VKFPFDLEPGSTMELVLFDSGVLPDLKQAKFSDVTGKEWLINPPQELLNLQKKVAAYHDVNRVNR
jgi:hypothetical protein